MARRGIGTWEIPEVLRRVHRGEMQRPTQRVTCRSPTTIRPWVAATPEIGWLPRRPKPWPTRKLRL